MDSRNEPEKTMSKKVVVTITETKRAKEDQPWKVRIEIPKKEPYEMPRRYSRLDAAYRGARRSLGAAKGKDGVWITLVGAKFLPIEFVRK